MDGSNETLDQVMVALASPSVAGEILGAFDARARVFGGSRAELLAALRRTPPLVLVLPVDGSDGLPTAGLVAELAVREPRVRTVIVTADPPHGLDGAALRAAGAPRIALRRDALGAVRAALAAAGTSLEQGVDARLQAALDDLPDTPLRALLRRAVRLPRGMITPAGIGRVAGLRYRTFCRHCRATGWPPPARIAALVRLLRYSASTAGGMGARARVAGFTSMRACREALLRVAPRSAPGAELSPSDILREFRLIA